MAAWGLVGIGGALIARATRGRISRVPLAVVCAIHIVISAGDFVTWRHVMRLLLYEPVTFVVGRPPITGRATRPCCAQSQIGVSPLRPW